MKLILRQMAVLAAVPLLGPAPVPTAGTEIVAATGTGFVRVTPDAARFDVYVRHKNRTAERALARTEADTAAVVAALLRHGVAARDIQHPEARVGQVWAKSERAYWFGGHQRLSVTVRQVGRAGRVAAAADEVGGEGTQIGQVRYELQDRTAALRLARRAAFADARAQAARQAEEAGLPLGVLRAIAENPTVCEAFGPNCAEDARSTSSSGSAGPVPAGSRQDLLRVETTAVWQLGAGSPPGSLEIGGVGIAVAAPSWARGSLDLDHTSPRRDLAKRRTDAAAARVRAALLAGGVRPRDISTRFSWVDRSSEGWRAAHRIEVRLRDPHTATRTFAEALRAGGAGASAYMGGHEAHGPRRSRAAALARAGALAYAHVKARDYAAITGRQLGELRSVTNASHQQMDAEYDGDGWPPPRGLALRTRDTSLPPGTQRVMHRLTAVWELR